MSAKATLQAVYDQLSDRLSELRKQISPVVVKRGAELEGHTEFGRMRYENDDEMYAALSHSSAVPISDRLPAAYNATEVQYWPELDALCVLRSRIAQYVEQTP